jgi:hypothetical protein
LLECGVADVISHHRALNPTPGESQASSLRKLQQHRLRLLARCVYLPSEQ